MCVGLSPMLETLLRCPGTWAASSCLRKWPVEPEGEVSAPSGHTVGSGTPLLQTLWSLSPGMVRFQGKQGFSSSGCVAGYERPGS